MRMFLIGTFTALCIGFLLSGAAAQGQGRCSRGCNLALGSYYIWQGSNLTFIAQMMSVRIDTILGYNSQITNPNSIPANSRINIPFSCDCIGGQFLGHVFSFSTFPGVTYTSIAQTYYSNLTTIEAMRMYNTYEDSRIPDTGVSLNVTVNCSCGDASVSRDYGLFITYTLRPGDTLESVAAANNLTAEVVRSYNPSLNFSTGAGVAFIPGRDQSGMFPTLSRGVSGLSPGAIAGISVAVVGGVLFVAGVLFILMQRRKHAKLQKPEQQLLQTSQGGGRTYSSGQDSSRNASASVVTDFTLQKSLEFSYAELATATNDFSIEYKIGEGGFGSVYYAELRDEKAAIKKMDMEASREFLAELKVLTHVHHRNLVRLIGYCIEGSLFLVYEYIENGNLSQHLRGSGREPLSWSTRVQIALDSARGLEYIHEHTVPVYVHRDIKPANILIDQNFHGKVADFGLTKLTDIGNSSLSTARLTGTFGYMPPEYAQYGDVSPKVDVYAFGVVLYELISAKEAIVKSHDSVTDSRGLVTLFEEALSMPDTSVELRKLIDPRLGDSYPLDAVHKMAQLAKACTHENPQQRPPMRSIVVTLMSLSSSTDDWDVGAFYGNQGLLNLMSGR